MGLFDVLKKVKDVADKVTDMVQDSTSSSNSSSGSYTAPTPQRVEPVRYEAPRATTVNMKPHFDAILSKNFAGYDYRCDVTAHELMPSAHPACTPIQYMFYKNGAPCLAIVLVKRNTYNGMNVKGTKNICDAMNIPYMRFYAEYPNEEAYVVDRIKKYL